MKARLAVNQNYSVGVCTLNIETIILFGWNFQIFINFQNSKDNIDKLNVTVV